MIRQAVRHAPAVREGAPQPAVERLDRGVLCAQPPEPAKGVEPAADGHRRVADQPLERRGVPEQLRRPGRALRQPLGGDAQEVAGERLREVHVPEIAVGARGKPLRVGGARVHAPHEALQGVEALRLAPADVALHLGVGAEARGWAKGVGCAEVLHQFPRLGAALARVDEVAVPAREGARARRGRAGELPEESLGVGDRAPLVEVEVGRGAERRVEVGLVEVAVDLGIEDGPAVAGRQFVERGIEALGQVAGPDAEGLADGGGDHGDAVGAPRVEVELPRLPDPARVAALPEEMAEDHVGHQVRKHGVRHEGMQVEGRAEHGQAVRLCIVVLADPREPAREVAVLGESPQHEHAPRVAGRDRGEPRIVVADEEPHRVALRQIGRPAPRGLGVVEEVGEQRGLAAHVVVGEGVGEHDERPRLRA